MAIAFQCPHCQKTYKVKDELAGKKSACVKCKNIIVVPMVSQLTAVGDSAALEALASNVLVDQPQNGESEEGGAVDEIPFECPYCFEHVKFPSASAGKQQPCPSCRRIVKVPALPSGKPKDWRVVEHNLTMARKDDGPAPEGAWGNTAKAQAIVSREALLEARVVKDRKELARRDWTKWYIALGLIALVGGVGGLWFYREKSADDQRLGLVADAAKAAEGKNAPLPQGWAAAIQTTIGSFYLNESPIDLKSAVKYLRLARSGAQQVDSPVDKTGLLLNLAIVQARLVGEGDEIVNNLALPEEESQKELRQTLQSFKDLGREDGWLAIESVARKIEAKGAKRPMMIALAPVALPTESDRADSLACVALILLATKKQDQTAELVIEETMQAMSLGGDSKSRTRTVALLVVRKQFDKARQILPEPVGEGASLDSRLAYCEGYARTGEPSDLEKARNIATANGTVEHQVSAMAILADAIVDVHQGNGLDDAVRYVAERAKKFTLPTWVLIRLGQSCVRANRADLARLLSESVTTTGVKPWLELYALQAELEKMNSPVDPAIADKIEDKSAAQALGWVTVARNNTRFSKSDPRATITSWTNVAAHPCGFAGAALGLQDRAK